MAVQRMDVRELLGWPKFRNSMRAFVTKSVAEVVRASVVAVSSAGLASAPIGVLLGTVSKDLVEALFARASQVESKLDRLIREPLLTGLVLARQGLMHERDTSENRAAADALLDNSHVALTRAWVLLSDSREDAVFVRAVDCIVLAAHRQHRALAQDSLVSLLVDLDQIRSRVALLEAEAAVARVDSEAFDRFLGRDSLRDKPIGHMDQRLVGNRIRRAAAKMTAEAQTARERLDILDGMSQLARTFVHHHAAVNTVPVHTPT